MSHLQADSRLCQGIFLHVISVSILVPWKNWVVYIFDEIIPSFKKSFHEIMNLKISVQQITFNFM